MAKKMTAMNSFVMAGEFASAITNALLNRFARINAQITSD